MSWVNEDEIRERVREGYARIARGESRSCCGSTCRGEGNVSELAERIGYDAAELAALPDGADMGLSCGNPTTLASLRPGEIVLDLGSGGGFDCFLAGPKVGPTGRVIGVDMTPDMVRKARAGLATYRRRIGWDNVEFRLGEIEHLPVADASVDVVISNCVINLAPNKEPVWREIARVLKPGGRVAVSDLALLTPLPDAVREMTEALIGCIAGAPPIEATRRHMEEAGLREIKLTPQSDYVDAQTDLDDPRHRSILQALPPGARLSDFVTSLNIEARKPEARQRKE